jgi:hypothetical protein
MNPRKRHRPLLLAGILLVLAPLACNVPGAATPTQLPPTLTSTPVQVGEASPTPSPTLAATDTPVPDVVSPGGCTLNAAYVADVTVPDDTEFAPGKAFTKVWRVRNSGTCTWETGTQLVFVSGQPMGGPAAVDAPSLAPRSTTDFSVNLTAPAHPGTYRGNWQLQAPDGTRFGSVIYVQIIVPSPATETPTPTPELTVTPTITPTTTPTPTTPTVPPPFDTVWETLDEEEGALGPPAADAVLVRWTADQRFDRGYMYWRNNQRSPADYVYVLYYQGGTDATQGTWERYEDTWTEDMDEFPCPQVGPPNGPIRGFGKVWCDHEAVRLDLAAAIEPEAGFYAGFQDFDAGTLLWASRLHFVYAVFADGTWQRFDEIP